MTSLITIDGQPLDEDNQWFLAHRGRFYHIREPREGERETDFRTLGDHDRTRRKIICVKIPETKKVISIPFLAFADEEIADDDVVLHPIVHDIMEGAAAEYGMPKQMVRLPGD